MRAPFSALRRLGALGALFGLLAQAVLPAAHAWLVDAEEAAYHASVHDAAPLAELCDDHDRGHRHHTDADCPLCPLFSSARLAAANGAAAAGTPDPAPSLPGGVPGPRASADVPGAPVRGPPPARA